MYFKQDTNIKAGRMYIYVNEVYLLDGNEYNEFIGKYKGDLIQRREEKLSYIECSAIYNSKSLIY